MARGYMNTLGIFESELEADEVRRALERDYINRDDVRLSLRFKMVENFGSWALRPLVVTEYYCGPAGIYRDVFEISPEIINNKKEIIHFYRRRAQHITQALQQDNPQ